MFSNLGPLFQKTFRQAEHTDTRQGIRREEKENQRQTEDETPRDQDEDLWEDSTNVSVDALRTFLINFLKGSQLTDKVRQADQQARPQPEKRPPADTATARAHGAYQNMAQKTAGTPKPAAPEETQPIDDADLIESDEIRLIHRLIEDLETLSAHGIDTLTIERAETFLKSLENAVQAAKN